MSEIGRLPCAWARYDDVAEPYERFQASNGYAFGEEADHLSSLIFSTKIHHRIDGRIDADHQTWI